MNPLHFLRLPEVKARTGKSRSAIYLGIKDGTFPAPVRIGRRAIAWKESSIISWQQDRMFESGVAVDADTNTTST